MKFRAFAILLLSALPALAHDLIIDAELSQPDVILSATYGLGVPAVDANVHIYSPSDSSTPSFEGRTDSDGRFRFVPSMEGDWLVVVDDGYGHREERSVAVTWSAPEADHSSRPSVLSRAGAGLAVIFGITALFVWGKKRTPIGP
jgi:nickel transport protein